MKCKYCEKEYKMEHHLKRHMSGCKSKDNVEVTNDIPESVNEPSDVSIELKRRIDKLKVTIRQSYDAEVRFRLECELKELESKIRGD
jgi:hypothetical protein